MAPVAGRIGSLPPLAGKLRNKADVAQFLLTDKKRREGKNIKKPRCIPRSVQLY